MTTIDDEPAGVPGPRGLGQPPPGTATVSPRGPEAIRETMQETQWGPGREPAARPDGIPDGDLQWPPVPRGGVTELRVHGVGGTPPNAMLDSPDPVQVSGDGVAGVWRRREDAHADSGRVEAYAWGGLTGRGFVAALWLLALPFSLVNLAGWMVPARRRSGFRGAARLAGLCVTALYVLGSAVAAMDVLAYQCAGGTELGRSGRCAAASWWLIGDDGPLTAQQRVLVGALVPVAVVVLLWRVTHRSRQAYECWDAADASDVESVTAGVGNGGEPVERPARDGLTHPGFWRGQAYAEGLAEVHIATGFTCVAVLLALSARELTTAPGAAALAVLGLAGLLACGVLTGVSQWRERLPRWWLVRSSLVLLAASAVLSWWPASGGPRPPTLPGTARLLEVANAGLILAGAWLLIAAGIAVRGQGLPLPTRLRRCGTPFAVVTVASVLLLTVQAGSILWLVQWLGSVEVVGQAGPAGTPPDIELGARYRLHAGVLLPALAVILLVAGVAWLRAARGDVADDPAYRRVTRAWQGRTPPRLWRDGWAQPGTAKQLGAAVRLPRRSLAATQWAIWTAAALALPVIGGYSLLWLRAAHAQGWPDGPVMVPELAVRLPWESISLWLLTALPVVAVFVLRQALTSPSARRIAATAWDVATFWPRSFHPLAPPSYAERAVPEIQDRIEHLFAGDGPDRRGAVLLLGHSQGSILVTAALATYLPRRATTGEVPLSQRLALVTYGCPLTRLYARNFPAYFDDELIGRLREMLRDQGVPGWRNFWRDTDPVGAGPLDGGPEDGSPEDVYLPDPPVPWHPRGDGSPPVRGHSETGYRTQGAFAAHLAHELDRLRGHLRSAGHARSMPPCRDPAQTPG